MNIHKNARLTPQGRCLLVRRVEELGWQMAEAANAAGISQRQRLSLAGPIPKRRHRGAGRPQFGAGLLQASHWRGADQ